MNFLKSLLQVAKNNAILTTIIATVVATLAARVAVLFGIQSFKERKATKELKVAVDQADADAEVEAEVEAK